MDMSDIREWLASLSRDELLDEAAWTREFLNRMAEYCGAADCSSLVAYVNRLSDENERLRELMCDVSEFFISGTIGACQLCDHLIDCANHPATSCWYGDKDSAYVAISNELYKRMRELGIEVDDE